MTLWNEKYNYLNLSCLLMVGVSSPISCMEVKETKEAQEEWRLLHEKRLSDDLNALCACSNVEKKQIFKVLHEEGGPTCTTNHRRLTMVNVLKQDASKKENQDVRLPVATAFAECGVQSASGFCNGIVEITTLDSPLMRSKKLEASEEASKELITKHKYSLQAYTDDPVIALQFSPDGWYMATLACKSLKLWERQHSMGNQQEKPKKNVPIIVVFDRHTKRSCCAIL